MSEHPQIEEMFDEYALGVLEGEEKRSFESHVKGCPECSHKLGEARARVALLALSAPQAHPSPAAKERLMDRVRAYRPLASPARLRAPFWGWGVPLLAAAVIVLAIATVLLVRRNHEMEQRLKDLQGQVVLIQKRETAEMARARTVLEILTSPRTLKVSLVAAPAHPVPQGKAFYNPQKGLLFYAANLPRLPSDRTYQLWLVPAQGKPISAGIFETDEHGNGEVLLPSLPPGITAKAFAVTVEPSGGEPQPTGKKVLIGAVS